MPNHSMRFFCRASPHIKAEPFSKVSGVRPTAEKDVLWDFRFQNGWWNSWVEAILERFYKILHDFAASFVAW